MDIIRTIYAAKLHNVEQGHVNCKSITITSVGRKLVDAITLQRVTKEDALDQITSAVAQLHSIGIAHCDICIDNVFVDVHNNVVFLGDLEYCQPKGDDPPRGIRRAHQGATTAEELDARQLETLTDELARL